MNDKGARVGAPSTTVVPRDPSTPTRIFPFLRLPSELRENVVVVRATDCDSRQESADLLLVNKEFHAIVAPIHWRWIVIDCDGLTVHSLTILATMVLPRYCSLVQSVKIHNSGDVEAEFPYEVEEVVANLVARIPNLLSLSIHPSLPRVISDSPFLDSLLNLKFQGGYMTAGDEEGSDVASLIARCPNLIQIELACNDVGAEGGRPLVAALASRQNLRILRLDGTGGWFSDDAAAVNWQGPISSLAISFANWDEFVSLSSFHSFVAQFSETLDQLELFTFIDHWFEPTTVLRPFPLPHLTDLTFSHPVIVSRTPALPLPILDIFGDSPVQTAKIDFTQGRAEDAYAGLKGFMQQHVGTLKKLRGSKPYNFRPQVDEDKSILREVEEYAKGHGIDFQVR